MHFDFDTLSPTFSYKLLASTVVPRPIAWVTTLNQDGAVNAGAFSFFNVLGTEPPLIGFNVLRASDRLFKDTAAHILEQGEFVVNLVSEAQARQMNITAMDAPQGFDEVAAAGLATLPSLKIAPPHIAGSPVSIECVNHATMLTGPRQTLVIGRVVATRVADVFISDPERGYIDTSAMQLIGRMHGSGFYTRTQDLFEMNRVKFSEWQNENKNNDN